MKYLRDLIRYPGRHPIGIQSTTNKNWIQRPSIKGVENREHDLFLLTREGEENPCAFALVTEDSVDAYNAPLASMKILGLDESEFEKQYYWWNTFWLDNGDAYTMIECLFAIRENRKSISLLLLSCSMEAFPSDEVDEHQDLILMTRKCIEGDDDYGDVRDMLRRKDGYVAQFLKYCLDVLSDSSVYNFIIADIKNRISFVLKHDELNERVCDIVRKHYPLTRLMATLSRYPSLVSSR